ncbi:MAG: type II toxin-antitoxin system Phd/YefM family antitoxin [Melioribacteraceae bacterium]|nr:type II toxin-antitoxin system Phd/YefM family antitoxin [Melioribacteraceae bacterium]MCF8356683.1 type II toxin-antitoxin system Phd/YefM family antitoxin [Melioribacteraceae bacterium]MCF8395553.1 type II toxin-antitoxin system Phd/YefM family antitoxin [Melioribacteraceae bacterium]MCF8420853.1 type II toxin-antitoxin system Phd/YefM family antitoxin [Melioribacteraceae bacterium]
MSLTASVLRQNIYKILDKVLETGKPVIINRKGKKLKIVSVDEVDKLSNLGKRKALKGDPEEIVHLDWSGEWKI